MCASYGLEIKERDLPTADERLATPELLAWLAANGPARIGTTRSVERGPFAPVISPTGFELSWWWLWSRGAPAKLTAFNARADKLTESPLWREPFRSGRVLIPVSHYFESANQPGASGRHRFWLPEAPLFAIAGITAPIGRPGYPATSMAMVTREPTPDAATVHDRMPLVLPASFFDAWLDPDREGDDVLRAEALAASDAIVGRLRHEPS